MMGQNLIIKKDDLWVKDMRAKYKSSKDLISFIDKRKKGFAAWFGIAKN